MSFRSGRIDVGISVAARAVSFLGDEVAAMALVLRAQPHGSAAVAAILAANLVPIVLLTAPVGRLVDRCGTRTLLLAASAVQFAACLALAFLPGPVAILACVAVLGAGQAVQSATWQALLPSLVRREELPAAVGLGQSAVTVAGLLAPVLGGVLTGRYGTRAPLLVDAATFVAVAGAALSLRRPRAVARTAGHQAGGLAIVRRSPLLRAAVGLLGLFVLLGSTVNVADVFLVRVTLHANATWYGLSAAAFSCGLLAGTWRARRIASPPGQARGLAVSAAVLGCGLVAMGLAPDVGWLLLFGAATGVSNGVLSVCASALVMGSAGEAERGRVAAALGGVVAGTQLAAYGVSGALATVLGPRAIFVLGGLAGLLAPVLLGRALVRAAGVPVVGVEVASAPMAGAGGARLVAGGGLAVRGDAAGVATACRPALSPRTNSADDVRGDAAGTTAACPPALSPRTNSERLATADPVDTANGVRRADSVHAAAAVRGDAAGTTAACLPALSPRTNRADGVRGGSAA